MANTAYNSRYLPPTYPSVISRYNVTLFQDKYGTFDNEFYYFGPLSGTYN